MRERKGELAHLSVVPLVARKVAHEVRQEAEQEHQDDERYGEILHRDSRMVADKEPCGRNAKDKFDNKQSHGAYKSETNGCGEIALVLEEHSTSGIIACVIWSDEGADIAIIDLALSAPDRHGFGFAKQQAPFACFCHDIDRHEQKGGNESEPQTDIAGAKGIEKRNIIVKSDKTICQITIRRKDKQRIENTEVWFVRFHYRLQRYKKIYK